MAPTSLNCYYKLTSSEENVVLHFSNNDLTEESSCKNIDLQAR